MDLIVRTREWKTRGASCLWEVRKGSAEGEASSGWLLVALVLVHFAVAQIVAARLSCCLKEWGDKRE